MTWRMGKIAKHRQKVGMATTSSQKWEENTLGEAWGKFGRKAELNAWVSRFFGMTDSADSGIPTIFTPGRFWVCEKISNNTCMGLRTQDMWTEDPEISVSPAHWPGRCWRQGLWEGRFCVGNWTSSQPRGGRSPGVQNAPPKQTQKLEKS